MQKGKDRIKTFEKHLWTMAFDEGKIKRISNKCERIGKRFSFLFQVKSPYGIS